MGPGIFVQVSSDFVGPLGIGSGWTIELWDASNETFWMGDPRILSTSATLFKTFGVEGITDWRMNPPQGGFKHGATGTLRVKRTNQLFEEVDSGTRQVTVDLISGMSYIQTALLSATLEQIKGNAADIAPLQADVTAIKSASFATFGSNLIPISSLIAAPPLGFLSREQIFPDRTGEGELTRPSGPVAVNAFGLAWEFVEVAPGIGVNEGAPDTLYTKPLQLNLVHTLGDSSLENTSIATFDYGDALWIFNPMLPTLVRYWIGPGITVRFFWLVIDL